MSRPSRPTTGPPDDPGASGAVCSMAPLTRRPRGPLNARSTELTKPSVARMPPSPARARATTGVPTPGADAAPGARAGTSPVHLEHREVAVGVHAREARLHGR